MRTALATLFLLAPLAAAGHGTARPPLPDDQVGPLDLRAKVVPETSRRFGNGAFFVDNVSADQVAVFRARIDNVFHDGTVTPLMSWTPPLTAGPGEGAAFNIKFFVPGTIPAGRARFVGTVELLEVRSGGQVI